MAGLRVEEAAQAAGVSARIACKWLKRFRDEGRQGLHNRFSRPHHCAPTRRRRQVEELVERRQARMTYRHISQESGIAVSTVARLLKRLGLNRLANLDPRPDRAVSVRTPR
ncbi:hypothetical protein DNK44_04555 [Pseudomonas dryadis]|uniref:DNA-binding domain-containing protein n=1 Tax=Phytopseudomonas dryadis TaxID=2487520 RepID=A0A4Q9R948_9GAMM|nr:hypothetical protein DNK44_04555 [Pseudomonas dryadis]